MRALDLREDKVGSRLMIYESTRMRTLCRWSRQSAQLQHTLHTGQASCAKRCRPGRQTTRCIGCAQLEHASSSPTCQRSIARMYAQSMTFFLNGIPYASKCMRICMHLQQSELYTHAPCMPRKDFAVLSVLHGNWTWRKWRVTSLFPLRSPCLRYGSSRTKLLWTQ